jgi:phosphoketolase
VGKPKTSRKLEVQEEEAKSEIVGLHDSAVQYSIFCCHSEAVHVHVQEDVVYVHGHGHDREIPYIL